MFDARRREFLRLLALCGASVSFDGCLPHSDSRLAGKRGYEIVHLGERRDRSRSGVFRGVDHRLACGADEGPAGPRGDEGFYAGYFRDLDGNKLNVFCFRPPA